MTWLRGLGSGKPEAAQAGTRRPHRVRDRTRLHGHVRILRWPDATLERALYFGHYVFRHGGHVWPPHERGRSSAERSAPIVITVVIATKFGILRDPKNPDVRGISGQPGYVRGACEGSLQRLGVSVVVSTTNTASVRRHQSRKQSARWRNWRARERFASWAYLKLVPRPFAGRTLFIRSLRCNPNTAGDYRRRAPRFQGMTFNAISSSCSASARLRGRNIFHRRNSPSSGCSHKVKTSCRSGHEAPKLSAENVVALAVSLTRDDLARIDAGRLFRLPHPESMKMVDR